MVDDYWGTDIAESLAQHYHKPYVVAKSSRYPFESEMFDAIWSIHVYKHIPQLQEALLEIKRLLKPGGVVLFAPAWQCRPWAADGYTVRPYGDFGRQGKMIKAIIPIRNSVLWRSMYIFPKRLVRHLIFWFGYRFKEILYRKLKPNYKIFWKSDADACNSIDPNDAILWFRSHGFECLSHPTLPAAFFVRGGSLIFRKMSLRKGRRSQRGH
jgi:SAM-dependent methyltransferase